MRPEPLKQAPHHFIRRWPKARRAERGPKEIVLTFSYGPYDCSVREAHNVLQQMSASDTPKGFAVGV